MACQLVSGYFMPTGYKIAFIVCSYLYYCVVLKRLFFCTCIKYNFLIQRWDPNMYCYIESKMNLGVMEMNIPQISRTGDSPSNAV